MDFSSRFVEIAKKVLPTPFTIAILLTILTFVLALVLTKSSSGQFYPAEILGFWESGFFDFLTFAMQMMLILVLGHVMALTKPVSALIRRLSKHCTNTAKAALIVTLVSIIMSLINWGLGLIVGAIFARKVAEFAKTNNYKINYPLIGAAGYSGLMVWHGGLSGSAPLGVSEANHKLIDLTGQILLNETIFSSMNIITGIILMIVVPLAMFWMGMRVKPTEIRLPISGISQEEDKENHPQGAEKWDYSFFLGIGTGLLFLITSFYKLSLTGFNFMAFLKLNNIIFLFFGLSILLHGNFKSFLNGVREAIPGAAGIMIQFPLYAGIMGIMTGSGLIQVFSGFFIQHSNDVTFPILTFFSAGLVNLFVPSGGGQWLVQGPIVIEASKALNVPLAKTIMALSYGDQITNMLQPFWALPLLGITGLKAKEILPFTLFLMGIGICIFIPILLIF